MAAMGSGDGGPSPTNGNGGGFTLGERIGIITERMETQRDDIKDLERTTERIQEHLHAQDEKLDALLTLAETQAGMQRDILNLKLQVAQYSSLEDHRRAHMHKIEERQDNILMVFAQVLQTLTQRVVWPLVAVALATLFSTLHAGGVWDRVSEGVIIGALGLAVLSGITSYVAAQRLKRRQQRDGAALPATTPTTGASGPHQQQQPPDGGPPTATRGML